MLDWIESVSQTLAHFVNGWLGPLAEFLEKYIWAFPAEAPLLAVVLLGTGLFVTVRLAFVQVRGFKHAVDITRGVYDNPEDRGDLRHFQALTTALSATVGIGNIAGVAIGVRLGGPGALFWMWVTAFFGMALKYAECTLALQYRDVHPDGSVSGGPMYYIEKGLGRGWKWMALLFAGCAAICSFGSGCMNQSNTLAGQVESQFGIPTVWTGLVFASLVALVIIGGIRRIGAVTAILAPGMAVLYIAGALVILLLRWQEIPAGLQTIFTEAFAPAPLAGGAAGSFLMTLMWGVRRGLFSNEAGQGSAPIAHATAKTKEPVREGLVASLGPFIDTLVICTLTGLVIVVTGVYREKFQQTTTLADLSAAPLVVQTDEELVRYLEADARVKDVASFDVRDGKLEGATFVAFKAMVEKAVVVDEGDEPWSGRLEFDPEDGSVGVADGERVPRVSGRMLLTGSPLTSRGFERGLPGNWGNIIVTLAVVLFAVSTGISWSYYGDRATEYLFGSRAIPVYRWIFVAFFFMGSILPLNSVWKWGDVALGMMSFPNLIALILLSGQVARMTREYYSREQVPFRKKRR